MHIRFGWLCETDTTHFTTYQAGCLHHIDIVRPDSCQGGQGGQEGQAVQEGTVRASTRTGSPQGTQAVRSGHCTQRRAASHMQRGAQIQHEDHRIHRVRCNLPAAVAVAAQTERQNCPARHTRNSGAQVRGNGRGRHRCQTLEAAECCKKERTRLVLVCRGTRVRWTCPCRIVDLGEGKTVPGAEIRMVLGDLHRSPKAVPPSSGWGHWGYGAHALGQAHSSTVASRQDPVRLSWALKTPSC